MKKIKYTHIMPVNSFVYNDQVINMIKMNKDKFDLKEHRFIFTNLDSYCSYQDLENVIFEDDLLNKNFKNFKRYIENSEIILMHSFPLSTVQLWRLNKNHLKKIVWIVWGHDLYNKVPKLEKNMPLYRLLRRVVSICLYPFSKIKITQIKAIGIGFKYDSLEIKKLYGDEVEIVMLPYGFKDSKEKIDLILNQKHDSLKIKKEDLKIMVGHSGYSFLNHEKILNQLLEYKNENIKISLPLSYGDEIYISKIEKKAKELFLDKVEIIKSKMDFHDYLKYLKTVDIVVLDFEHQAALGNIFLLLYLGKKIYLAKKGIIYFAMKAEGINISKAEDIGILSYEEFTKDIDKFDQRAYEYSSYILDEKNLAKQWESTLKDLN